MKSQTLLPLLLLSSPLFAHPATPPPLLSVSPELSTPNGKQTLEKLEKRSENALSERATLKRQYADDNATLIEKLRANDRRQIELLGDRIQVLTGLIYVKEEGIEAAKRRLSTDPDKARPQLRQLLQEKLSLLQQQRELFLRYEEVIQHKDEVPNYPITPLEERLLSEIALLRGQLEVHIQEVRLEIERLNT